MPRLPRNRPDQAPPAQVDGADTPTPRITAIDLRGNPRYRTASGVGIGTPLEALERVYGSRLVVDRVDGWDRPTQGLLASYQDVAAVRDGDRAITYTLRDDVVEAIEVSDAASWGDDEGCA